MSLIDTLTGAVKSIPLGDSIEWLFGIDWSPVGDWLLMVSADKGNRPALWIIKPDGSGQRQLLQEESVVQDEWNGLSARWAPKGDAIYYLKGAPTQELWKLPLPATAGQPLEPSVQLLSGLPSGQGFGVFRDGKRLVCLSRSDRANLWVGVLRTSHPEGIQLSALTTGTFRVSGPRFSPDGARIAYASGDATASNIFVIPTDGGSPRRLTSWKSVNLQPAWSPDGRAVAFGSNEGGSTKVWQIGVEGGAPRPFSRTNLSSSFSLAWAPGHDVLYHRPGNRNFSILDPRSETESPLTKNDEIGWMFGPSYSPDGKSVAILWNRRPAPGLYVIPLDGSIPDEGHARRVSGRWAGGVEQSVDAAPYRGKSIKLTAHVRTDVSGANGARCWLRVDRPKAQRGFFEDMANRPIRTSAWGPHEIVGQVDADGDRIVFGCLLKASGRMWVDDIELSSRDDLGRWLPIGVKNAGFEDVAPGQPPAGWIEPRHPFTARVVSEGSYKGKGSLQITGIGLSAGEFYPIGWSPDGRFLYATNLADLRQVFAIPAEGGEARIIITLPVPEGTVYEIAISPDGRRVAFTVADWKSDVRIVSNFDPSVR